MSDFLVNSPVDLWGLFLLILVFALSFSLLFAMKKPHWLIYFLHLLNWNNQRLVYLELKLLFLLLALINQNWVLLILLILLIIKLLILLIIAS